jgi:hypothetical protein
VTRFEALQTKARLYADPEWAAKLVSGDPAAKTQLVEISKTLADTGGLAKGDEFKIGEYSVGDGR